VDLEQEVKELFANQIREWDLAKDNYRGLQDVQLKSFNFDRYELTVQFNPKRIISSAAKVDAQSIKERQCFLCAEHLPKEQKAVAFKNEYSILINPYPIFPQHLTIPKKVHTDQRIKGNFEDMLELAAQLTRYTIFYNGPKCGASAPDHFHFQAGYKGMLPIELDADFWEDRVEIKNTEKAKIYSWKNYGRGTIYLESSDKNELTSIFDSIYEKLQAIQTEEAEPMMNILAMCEQGQWRVFIFPRKLHRPWQFAAEGDRQIVLSPASVDMGGVLITPREEDFNKIREQDLLDIFQQVCFSEDEILSLFK